MAGRDYPYPDAPWGRQGPQEPPQWLPPDPPERQAGGWPEGSGSDQTVRLPGQGSSNPPYGSPYPPYQQPTTPPRFSAPPPYPVPPPQQSSPPPPPPSPPARPKRRRRLIGILASLVVLGLALGAVAVIRPGPVDRWLHSISGDPILDPLPNDPTPSAVLAGVATDAPMPTVAGVTAALTPLVVGSVLGERVNVSVVDVATGERLYGRGDDTPTLPASTNKLVTAVAVLATRGPTYRIPTRAVAGDEPGEVVLVGGGDPALAINGTGSYAGAARLDQLAAQVKEALGNTAPTKVTVDSSLFSGAVYGPWDADIAHNGYAGPTVALMTDGARVDPKKVKSPSQRYTQPDIAAGKAFAKALGLSSAAVSAVSKSTAPSGGQQLGEVESIPIGRLVEFMLSESDNVVAEMLARQVALAKGQPASYAGAAAATKSVLTELGLPESEMEIFDGSGFSRKDRLTPSLLTDLLRLAADVAHPELNGLFAGLPVAGWSGTLQERYREKEAGSQAGAGYVRAKTGTLAGVNAIAGIVVDADGRPLAFAVMADAVPASQTTAQNALDRVAAKLATCGCR